MVQLYCKTKKRRENNMKNKRKVLNDKGLTLYITLLIIAIILTTCDSTSLAIFTITKFMALANMAILYKLLPYIPARLK